MAIIDKPSDYFNTNLYTGNSNATSHAVGFQPDWTWLKVRNANGGHFLFDSVRGATKTLFPDRADAEYVNSTGSLTSFNSDGFTVGGGDGANKSGSGIASWNWLANGAGSANTDGSISSTVSANTTSGFSIVTVANVGSANFTFGHGLGVAPSWVLAKSRDGGKWNNYFKSLGAGYTIQLPETGAKISNTAIWQNTNPTSSVVYSNGDQLDANESYVFYCFAEKQGYSKFGSYTGNGNADGTFIYTGFSPAFVMVKRTDSANSWNIKDNRRNNASTSFNINPRNATLLPNDSAADQDANALDFLSNGFKNRSTGNDVNNASGSYIYMAFAENPFTSSTGTPVTAR